MWDWTVFVIGLLSGLIIMVLLSWFAYNTRLFVFSQCPRTLRRCSIVDYYIDPGQALASGEDLGKILFLNSQNQLYYRRPLRNYSCVPAVNRATHISYPQYCLFTGPGGTEIKGKQIAPSSNVYRVQGDSISSMKTIVTGEDCQPQNDAEYVMGRPVLDWDTSSKNID